MLDIHQLLLDRLQQRGVDPNDAAPFFRDLLRILESKPRIELASVNSKLQLMGWNDVTLNFPDSELD